MGNTLSRLLKRFVTAQVTVDSGYVVNLKGSGYDIVFARRKGAPLLYIPPNYSHRGAVRILKKCLDMQLPSSSIPATVSFDTYGEYQVICESQKQGYLTDLTSAVLRVEKAYENDFTLMFGLPEIYLPLIREGGPSDSYPLERGGINPQSPYYSGSVQSEAITKSPCSSTFDLTVQSHETRPSTVPTSLPHKPQNPKGAMDSLQTTECQAEEEGSISSSHHREEQNQWSPGESGNDRAECDTATTYSFDTLSDDPKFVYFQAFIDQLAEDVRAATDGTILQNVGQVFLDQTLRDFAWKLHEESTNPFQLETSVIIHRKRR